MPYCTNCGKEIVGNVKFCSNCGAVTNNTNNVTSKRQTVFEGNIHKCPNCGEVLPSFAASCSSCGYEIRGNSAADSVKELYNSLNKEVSASQKDSIIRNFPIPNSKEDILEFMILASSNILGEDNRDIYEAWLVKFEQAYQKSLLLFRTDKDFSKIQQIYDNCQINIDTEKQRKINKFTIDTIIRNITVGIGLVPYQEKRKLPTQLPDFNSPTVNTYSIETTIAEKLDAILSLMEFSSRMKDYYDIYYLANKFDFDGAILTEALKKTFANRNHNFTLEQFQQMIEFDSDDAMQKKWKAFVKKINIKTDDFEIVLKTIKNFLLYPYVSATEGSVYKKLWEASTNEWKDSMQ